MSDLRQTLGSKHWMKENESSIKSILPQTWTHSGNLNLMRLMFQLKVVGIDWRSEEEFVKVMSFLEKIGILIRDGELVRANPAQVFK